MTHDWPAVGDLLAQRYRLVARLESGGMADIWRADDELLERPVALKLPTDRTATSAEALHLAWKEARLAARPSHPGIAVVHDYNGAVSPDGSVAPFVVMELLTGETLAARVERARLPWREAARVGTAVAEALAAAHACGVVHRDIKPGNVMLTPTGVKILDFGISAITGEPDDDETGATFGTPAYVAPERLDGKPAEPATDVYGLGVLLYEMVTGRPPYPVDTWEELDAARATPPPELPADLPADFRRVVSDCLRDEPGRRPTAEEAADRLSLIGAEPPPRHAARRRIAVPVGIATAVAAVAGAVVLITRPDDDPAAERAAPPAPTAGPARTAPSPSTLAEQPPPAPPPTTRRTSPPPPVAPDAELELDFDEAMARVRTAVEDGREEKQIRPDVAVDLLNLLGNLEGSDADGIDDRVVDLRQKVRSRAQEGSVARDRADILLTRLTDLSRAAGS